MNELVYLACPYSHPDEAVRQSRFEAANRAAGKLMAEGLKVFSPISHCHSIALSYDLPLTFDFWQDYNFTFLSLSHKLIVLTLDGWFESKGVCGEIAYARENNISIGFMEAV